MGTPTSARDRIHFQDELTWKELDALPREHTLALVSVAPVQAHGPHLPLGFHGTVAQALALATARELCRRCPEWHVLLCPHLALGATPYRMTGSVDVRPRVVRSVLEDFGAALARDGFRYVVVISPHVGPGHVRAVEDACEWVSRKFDVDMVAPMGPAMQALHAGEYDARLQRAAQTTPPVALAQDFHAGCWETSLALYLRPDAVKPGYLDLKPVLVAPETLGPETPSEAGNGEGYLGSPHLATAELGRAGVEVVARDLAELVVRLLNGEDVTDRVTSPAQAADFLYEYSHATILVLSLIALALLLGLYRLL